MTVRLATAAVFLVATVVAATAPVPSDLPASALGQVAVYRVEVLLGLVYGGLLVLMPFFHGVLRAGRGGSSAQGRARYLVEVKTLREGRIVMKFSDDHVIARRIAEISAWSFDEALEALQEGGERREIALHILRSSERTEKVLERSREFRRNLRRYRLGLF